MRKYCICFQLIVGWLEHIWIKKCFDKCTVCQLFKYVALQLYDVWVVDNLATVSQGALGNHERHFLNVAKEWLCNDWRNRFHRRTYIFLSLKSPAPYAIYLQCALSITPVLKLYFFFLGGVGFIFYISIDDLTHQYVSWELETSLIFSRNPYKGVRLL